VRGYASVTELPGHGATQEQLSMMHNRYRFAAELSKDKDVLELACGPGVALGYLKTVARRVVGGDVDEQLVKAASRHYGSRIEVRQIDAQNIPFDDQTFDVILLLEAIYYLPDARTFVSEAKRVLRPDGVVMICTANRERPDFNPSPYTHQYFSAAELQQLLLGHGFLVELFGAFPTTTTGLKSRLLWTLRQAAIKLHLIPKTMAWKIWLKRMFFGKLTPIPLEIVINQQQCTDLVPIDPTAPVRDYKVIYAVGRRAA
jgi:ubiquinone/menaquinone biosynthesis C-methylase UbiE